MDVADVRIVPSVTEIHRDAVARRIDVTADVRGRDLGAVGDEIEDRIRSVMFPLEYRAELLGEYAERDAAEERVLAFAIAAAIGILLLLQAAFRSWRLSMVIFLTLPMSLVGGVIVVFLTNGGMLSFGSFVGLIAVLGIAVFNVVMIVSRFRQLEQQNGNAFDHGLVIHSTREQSAPILTTTVITALAFLPLVFFGNIAGLEILRPMALVVLGGLVSTIFYTMIGVPAMYLMFGAVREPDLELGPATVPIQEKIEELA
jgi:Cu/Ag efflux pump CusA